jgi:hypothetical protein
VRRAWAVVGSVIAVISPCFAWLYRHEQSTVYPDIHSHSNEETSDLITLRENDASLPYSSDMRLDHI